MQSISPINRVGGKFRMTGRLLELLPPHETYIEPFFGAGHLFFAKERTRLEIINDLDGELINFYRVVAYHSAELEAWLRFLPHSRQTWDELERQPELTDIQRAVLWFWRNRVSFSGKGENFGVRRKPGTSSPIMRDFTGVAARLEGVIIEHKPAFEVMEYYDSPEVLFFLDPPYVGTTQKSYGTPLWGPEERDELLERLRGLQGRWLLTIGGEVDREALEGLSKHLEERQVRYTVGKAGQRPKRRELIATSYEPPVGKV